MFNQKVVSRLLAFTKIHNNKHIITAFYATKSANTCNFKYVNRYLDDESYISRGLYKVEIANKDVYFEYGDNYEQFKHVIASGYDMVIVMVGEEEENIFSIIEKLPDDNNMIFQRSDNILNSYQILDNYSQKRELKRKSSWYLAFLID